MAIDYQKLKHWPFPEIEQSYTAKDTILYALGLGLGADPTDKDQLRFVYEDGLKALPTMAVVLGSVGPWSQNPETGINWKMVLHGEQSVVLHKPLPPAATVLGRSAIEEIVDKGAAKGALLYTRREIRNKETGELLASLDSTSFLRGDGGFGGPSGPAKPVHALPERAPDLHCDIPTLPQAALIYRLSGDNHPFTIKGIVAHGKGARYFMSLKKAQELLGVENRVSMFYVRSKGNTEAARAEILKLAPNHRVLSMSEYVSLMSSSNLPELKPFVRSMVGLGIVISFLVVLLNMHTMVMERTREVGILKALGFSRIDVVRMLLGETLVLTLMGCGLGILLTFVTQAVLKATNPGLPVLLTPRWIVSSIVLALVGATAGVAYPAFRAASYDPVVALAYE